MHSFIGIWKTINEYKAIMTVTDNAAEVPKTDIPPDIPVGTVLRFKISYGGFEERTPISDETESMKHPPIATIDR